MARRHHRVSGREPSRRSHPEQSTKRPKTNRQGGGGGVWGGQAACGGMTRCLLPRRRVASAASVWPSQRRRHQWWARRRPLRLPCFPSERAWVKGEIGGASASAALPGWRGHHRRQRRSLERAVATAAPALPFHAHTPASSMGRTGADLPVPPPRSFVVSATAAGAPTGVAAASASPGAEDRSTRRGSGAHRRRRATGATPAVSRDDPP